MSKDAENTCLLGCKTTQRLKKGLCPGHYTKLLKYGDPTVSKVRERKICSIEGCGKISVAYGWCPMHHARWKEHGDPLKLLPKRIRKTYQKKPKKPKRVCLVPECEGGAIRPDGYCSTHSYRFQKFGDPNIVSRKMGEGTVQPNGYKTVPALGHPNAMSNGRILEHVLIMSNSLGRPLVQGENVHHKNGVRTDNRLVKGHELICPDNCCNLELWSVKQPPGQRIIDKIKYAKEILELYDPEYFQSKGHVRFVGNENANEKENENDGIPGIGIENENAGKLGSEQ